MITQAGRHPTPLHIDGCSTSKVERLFSTFPHIPSTPKSKTTTSCWLSPFGTELLKLQDSPGITLDSPSSTPTTLSVISMKEETLSSRSKLKRITSTSNTDSSSLKLKRKLRLLFSKTLELEKQYRNPITTSTLFWRLRPTLSLLRLVLLILKVC